jgi:hypothetical protein
MQPTGAWACDDTVAVAADQAEKLPGNQVTE